MFFLGITSMIVFYIFFLNYFKNTFMLKRQHWIFYVAAAAIYTSAVILSDFLDLHRLGVFLVMGAVMVTFNLLFHGNSLQTIYAGCIFIFSSYSSRGIIVSIYSLVLQERINEVLTNYNYYYSIIALAVLLSMLLGIFIRRVVMSDTLSSRMVCNQEPLRFMVIYLIFELTFLLIVNDGRFLEVSHHWFTPLYLMSFAMSKIGLYFVIIHTTKISDLVVYEMHTRQLQEQLSLQMRHYQSYCRFTESYRAFRHDYENMMTTVKTFLRNQEYEQAVRILDEIHDTMQKDVRIHRTYSNNVLMDAILQDTANACEEHDIKFSSVLHIPGKTLLSDLDLVRVFSNIMDNAIEACQKVSDGSARFINVRGGVNENWAYVEISNSFSGEIKFLNGEPVTTKQDKDQHGFGLMIVRNIIEGAGGIMLIDVNPQKRTFTLKLHVPKN